MVVGSSPTGPTYTFSDETKIASVFYTDSMDGFLLIQHKLRIYVPVFLTFAGFIFTGSAAIVGNFT